MLPHMKQRGLCRAWIIDLLCSEWSRFKCFKIRILHSIVRGVHRKLKLRAIAYLREKYSQCPKKDQEMKNLIYIYIYSSVEVFVETRTFQKIFTFTFDGGRRFRTIVV